MLLQSVVRSKGALRLCATGEMCRRPQRTAAPGPGFLPVLAPIVSLGAGRSGGRIRVAFPSIPAWAEQPPVAACGTASGHGSAHTDGELGCRRQTRDRAE